MMLCDQHRRLSVDRDRETPGSAMWTSAAEAISSIAAFSRVPTENRKGFASTYSIDAPACLATSGVTETLRR
jgi:hypothetical protein